MVPTTSRSKSTLAYRNVVPEMLNRCLSFSRTNSTKKGNERQTPARGRYKRCSKMTSIIETTLEVGARVMKNQKIENANTGLRRRSHQPSTTRLERNRNEAITAGSRGLVEGLKS